MLVRNDGAAEQNDGSAKAFEIPVGQNLDRKMRATGWRKPAFLRPVGLLCFGQSSPATQDKLNSSRTLIEGGRKGHGRGVLCQSMEILLLWVVVRDLLVITNH